MTIKMYQIWCVMILFMIDAYDDEMIVYFFIPVKRTTIVQLID